ncbi:MAG: hypothetical protein KAF91_06830 [Nostoc sp. TH1S01]|nr:hypothetical protein [Nostoc sp. TH1S01]
MLDIFILISTFSSPNLPISPSISQRLARQNYDYSKCRREIRRRHGSNSILNLGIQPKMILMAMSNAGEFTSNQLWQQLYGTTVLDEDLELSDEDLELAQGGTKVSTTYCSDVFVGGQQIISFSSILPFLERPERHQALINYIRREFERNNIPVGSAGITAQQIYGRIAEHLRATAPIQTKREHRGLKIALTGRYAGVECYLDTPCQY